MSKTYTAQTDLQSDKNLRSYFELIHDENVLKENTPELTDDEMDGLSPSEMDTHERREAAYIEALSNRSEKFIDSILKSVEENECNA
jgi:hypothetical protein